MRLKSILLSAILFSCLSVQTLAIDPGDIASPSISAPNMDMPTPKVTSPSMTMPETKTKPPVQANDNQNQPVSQNGSPNAMDVSGKWSIKLEDRTDVSLDLTLWSSAGDKIMGYGTMMEDGATNSVTASGSFAAQELTLTAKSAVSEYPGQKYDECSLYLFGLNNTMSGTYVLKSGGKSSSNGNATALKLSGK